MTRRFGGCHGFFLGRGAFTGRGLGVIVGGLLSRKYGGTLESCRMLNLLLFHICIALYGFD